MYWILVSLFSLLNALDLLLTTHLMTKCRGWEGGGTVESNLVASYVYEQGGVWGLAAFKTVVVLLVLALSWCISSKSLCYAYFVLGFGILVASIGLLYSLFLVYEMSSIQPL